MRMNSCFATAAHKPRFRQGKLLFVLFQSSLHRQHRRQAHKPPLYERTSMPEGHLRKEPVISIVDDDQFVRDSLKRLMKSLGYMVVVYPSAGDFLKSPELEETSCLIADSTR